MGGRGEEDDALLSWDGGLGKEDDGGGGERGRGGHG